MSRAILKHFGIDGLPLYRSHSYLRVAGDIGSAIQSNEFAAISGDVGMGKSCLFNDVARQYEESQGTEVKFVYVRNFFKEKLTISNILNALIMDLSDERIRMDLEARSRQAVRLVGESYVTHKKRVCVVIEEAHRLHFNTLRSIKELREATFAGHCPLFSVILIGHPLLSTKLKARKEVYWRSTLHELNEANGWMTFEDRCNYLESRYSAAITDEARQRIAMMCKAPLEMDVFVLKRMREAYQAGKDVLDSESVDLSLNEQKELLGVSLNDIAKEAQLGRTTVHQALTGTGTERSAAAVKQALQRLGEKKIKEAI